MKKPKIIIWGDGSTASFKDVCVGLRVKYVWIKDIKIRVPEGWLCDQK